MLVLVTALALGSQSSVPDTARFGSPPLPPPTATRTASGAPGPRYWQQRADYVIRATLDTGARMLRGSQRIYYTNRSPHTLRVLWLAGFADGMTITRLAAGGRPVTPRVLGTTRRVDLPFALRPGRAITIEIGWRSPVPTRGDAHIADVDSRWYHLELWYPRMAVYDDVHGWDTIPSPSPMGGASYLEYGDFDVYLTVPAGFLVAATGMVANADVVRTPRQLARLARAVQSAQSVAIVTRAEAAANAARRVPGTKTWRFIASTVRDFAWAAGPALRWDASAWDGILVQTFYHPDADSWEHANGMLRATLQQFSHLLGRYPWPQLSSVEGRAGDGAGHPMLLFGAAQATRDELFRHLADKVAHQWFPMQVGSDGRRYPWMHEALAAFAASGLTNRPAGMLSALRDSVGGLELERALREYVRRWRGRHPQPADLLRTIRDVTGRGVDWWRQDGAMPAAP